VFVILHVILYIFNIYIITLRINNCQTLLQSNGGKLYRVYVLRTDYDIRVCSYVQRIPIILMCAGRNAHRLKSILQILQHRNNNNNNNIMSRILKFSRHPKWCDKIQTISDRLSRGQQQKNTHRYHCIICSLSNHPLCWPNSKFDCAIAWYNSAEIKTCLRGVFSLQTRNNIYIYIYTPQL